MSRRAAWWALLAVAVSATAAWVAVPVWLLQPFAPQSEAAVTWSWQLRRLAPAVTVALTALSLVFAAALWPAPAAAPAPPARMRGVARRLLLVLLIAVSGATAWFARQNHFEWMFRPFPDARFVAAAAAGDVPPEEPVIGVAQDGHAIAFPITRIGYHHLVNTTLGAVPIVATY